jgi:hypothetical protein
MDMKSSTSFFWTITPCSQLKVNTCFGRTYRFHLQWRRISQSRNQREVGEPAWWNAACLLLVSCLAYSTCSSETSDEVQGNTRCCITEDVTLYFIFCSFRCLPAALFPFVTLSYHLPYTWQPWEPGENVVAWEICVSAFVWTSWFMFFL